MKLSVSRSAARSAAFAAVVARMFIGLALEQTGARNGVWLCPWFGALAALAWLIGLDRLSQASVPPRSPAALPLALALLTASFLDSAMSACSIARTAGYLALDRIPLLLLALPACLAALWCAVKNGDTVGYGAMLWIRIFPALLLLVALLQVRHYRPQWLFPILGDGWDGILNAGIKTAGWIVPAASVMLVADPDPSPQPRRRIAWRLLAAAGAVSVLLLLASMMRPTPLRPAGWLGRLDALLTNGRAPLSLQLPMIVMWFAAHLHLLACEIFACACLLQRLLPSLDGRVCAALVAVSAGLVACSRLPLDSVCDGLYRWLFVAVASLTAFATLFTNNSKGDARA